MRTFVFTDAKSNKFWHIELSGNTFTVTFGRVGTNGQSQTKAFADAATAKKEHDKLVAEKLKKGYVETTPAAAVAPAPAKPVSTEQAALEKALLAHPDEIAAHSAYADYLTEAGDPRGEFIQVQLALEDENRPKADRDALRKREKALLKEHGEEWLGELGRFFIGEWSGEDKPYYFRFARGWLETVRTMPVPEALVEALARSPETRLVRRLEIVYDMRYHAFNLGDAIDKLNEALPEEERVGEDDWYGMLDPATVLPVLAESPYLTNLRVLKYGFSDDHPRGPSYSTMLSPFDSKPAELLDVLGKCPRLEELYLNTELHPIDEVYSSKLLGNLRVFQHYYGSNYSHYRTRSNPYPLSTLARNKALKSLHTLRVHPGRDATIDLDEFDALVRSKNLPALAHLQVRVTTFGDDGATALVSSGILKRLKTLDVSYGNMTDEGARVLAASPDLKNLASLDVSLNALTPAGVNALKATGITVIADNQHGGGEDDNDYRYSVDWE